RATARSDLAVELAHPCLDVQRLDQHERPDARPRARVRRSLAGVDDPGAPRLGIQADRAAVPELRALRRILPLRDARRPAARRARVVLLSRTGRSVREGPGQAVRTADDEA